MDAKIKAFLGELEIATGHKAKKVKADFAKALNEADARAFEAVRMAREVMPLNGWIALAVAAALALCAGYAMGRV